MAYYASAQNMPIPSLGRASLHETSRDQRLHGLGQACPPCYIPAGGQCVSCPEGSDLPECLDCVGGQLRLGPMPWYERPLAGPVVVGLVSAVALGIAVPFIRRQLGKRGVHVE